MLLALTTSTCRHELHLTEFLALVEFYLLVVVTQALLRLLQHSDSSSAMNSPTLLCLIDINSLFGHERACLSLNAASHTESDGIRFSGILYLLFKLPGRRCVQRETILLDWQCGEQTPRTNFHTRFDCSLGDLFRHY